MDHVTAIAHMRDNTRFNQLRTIFSSEAARIEQDALQRKPSGPVDVRIMEFAAVMRILNKAEQLGVIERYDGTLNMVPVAPHSKED